VNPSGVPRRVPAPWPGSSSPPSLTSNFGFSPSRRHPALSPPPNISLSFFYLPPITLILYNSLTEDPSHPQTSSPSHKNCTLFPYPTHLILYLIPFPARLSSLYTLIETLNAAPLRRGLPLIISSFPTKHFDATTNNRSGYRAELTAYCLNGSLNIFLWFQPTVVRVSRPNVCMCMSVCMLRKLSCPRPRNSHPVARRG